MRSFLVAKVAQAILVMSVVSLPCRAQAGSPGTMIITAEPVEPGPTFDAKLRKSAVKTLTAKDGQWSLFYVAYLKRAVGAPEVNVVFYDAKDKGEPTSAFQITTQADARAVSGTLSFSKEQGFKAGHTYDVRVTRLIGGKEEVFARTALTLK